MKSLKPINETNTSTLISVDALDALHNAIETINSHIQGVDGSISQLSRELQCTSLSKASIRATDIDTDTLSASGSITTNDISAANWVRGNCLLSNNGATVCGDLLVGNDINSASLHTNCLSSDNASITSSSISTLSASDITSNTLSSGSVTTPTLTSENISGVCGDIGTLSVNRINGLFGYNAEDISGTNLSVSDTATISKVQSDSIRTAYADIYRLYNVVRNFVADEGSEGVLFTTDSSTPVFIELPPVNDGWQRVTVRKEDGSYYSLNFFNSLTAPLVQYSKTDLRDIDAIYFDTITRKFYIETRNGGRLFYATDDKGNTEWAHTMATLPVDVSLDTTMSYKTPSMNRIVILGAKSSFTDWGLAVQGVLEADIIKENRSYHQLFFYGDLYKSLITFASSYLTYDGTHLSSETAGYVYHKNTDYTDSEGTLVEPLEKISFDGETITLTVDTKWGQDEIQIRDEEGPLPFILSFTASSLSWDKAMNESVFNSYAAVERS